jgi:hypothetical protein
VQAADRPRLRVNVGNTVPQELMIKHATSHSDRGAIHDTPSATDDNIEELFKEVYHNLSRFKK